MRPSVVRVRHVAPDDNICGHLAGISELHRETLEEHGVQPRAVGWKDEATQLRRFQTLTDVIDATDRCRSTILAVATVAFSGTSSTTVEYSWSATSDMT